MIHHGSIRKYTAALLDLFNSLEIQYKDSNGTTLNRNVPIRYSAREKSTIFDEYTTEQLLSGNYNVLPRANLSFASIIRSDERVMNKNMKINQVSTENGLEFMYNSVPYEITYELNVLCRGMNEATMIMEQVLPKFNPIYSIDIWDAQNLNEPTRIPVKILDVSVQSEDYEELSQNIMTVTFSFSIQGNLYPPIKTVERIKEFKILINEQKDNYFNRKSIMGWDVDDGGKTSNETIVDVLDNTQYAPQIIDLVCNNFSIGSNDLTLIYDDKDNKYNELTFPWDLLQGDGELVPDGARCVFYVHVAGVYEIQVTTIDLYGNYNSLSKEFTI